MSEKIIQVVIYYNLVPPVSVSLRRRIYGGIVGSALRNTSTGCTELHDRPNEVDEDLRTTVFPGMRPDEVFLVAKTDRLVFCAECALVFSI
ncbi:hypothetical protein WA026_017675 [Henosepilachna vigintioctopunctata]|uniref:Uncharacterized protein n=1 Tax=Henosepilachna vigintioctopunctata TaxID=420089 RepID=A0AAW1U3Y7_9CUCU